MAELGVIASVTQIAEVGLRLSIKLYTFGEIVASADRSVISISKDVSLTSSVLRELGQVLDKDGKAHLLSKNAVDTAGTVVNECLEVFQEMESILVKKLPNLSTQTGRTTKPALLLERLKWPYLQPKLRLLCSNLDRLESTLLLMLNVITYASQVAEKTEPASVIADQRSLIEDLARSNQEYIRKYKTLKLAIEASAASQNDELKHLDVARMSISKPDATPDAEAATNAVKITMSASETTSRDVLDRKTASSSAEGIEQDALIFHVKDYLNLLNNLLNEIDETKYKIRESSRTAIRFDVCHNYDNEMQQLKTTFALPWWGDASNKLAPLATRLEERVKHARNVEARAVAASPRPTSPQTATADEASLEDQSVPMPKFSLGEQGELYLAREGSRRDSLQATDLLEDSPSPMITQEKHERQQSESQPRRTLLNNLGAAGSNVASVLEDRTEPRTYEDVNKRHTLSLDAEPSPPRPFVTHKQIDTSDLFANPEALPDGVIIRNRRACLESRDYQSSPLDDLVETNDDGVLKSSKADYWGFVDRLVYQGSCSRGSILEFLRSVTFIWPNEIGLMAQKFADSLQSVQFADRGYPFDGYLKPLTSLALNLNDMSRSRRDRFLLKEFSHPLLELHERLNEISIDRARDQDLDQLQAKLMACQDVLKLCESFGRTLEATLAQNVPLDSPKRVIVLDRELSDSLRDILKRIHIIHLPRFVKIFANRRFYQGPLPTSEYPRLSKCRPQAPQYHPQAPQYPPQASQYHPQAPQNHGKIRVSRGHRRQRQPSRVSLDLQSSDLVDVVDKLVEQWTNLPADKGAAEEAIIR